MGKNAWILEDLEKTAWAVEFKADSPVSYSMALKYAARADLSVEICKTDEAGETRWVIVPEYDTGFWMDAKPTRKEAIALCREMGWKII